MRHFFAATAAAFCLTVSTSAFAADASACDQFARTVTQDVIKIFHETGKTVTQKRTELSNIFQSSVDINWIGKFVIGRYWRDASDEEKAAYLKAYRTYLTNTYISKFDDEDGFKVEDIQVTSLAAGSEPNQFVAKTVIKQKADEDVHVDYALDVSTGKCQVQDITVEGVSLLVSQRSEFQSLAGSSGIKGVIAALQKHTAAPAKQ